MRFVMAAWAVCRKDLRMMVHPLRLAGHPVRLGGRAVYAPSLTTLAALLVPLSYTLVAIFGSAAVTANPVAVVNLDHGPAGAAIVAEIVGSDVFRVTVTTPDRARAMYADLRAAAIITIPADLSARLARHQSARIDVAADNLNRDIGDDLLRGPWTGLLSYYQHLGPANPVKITVAEHVIRDRVVQLWQYSVLPVIILITTVTGIIMAGMAAAGEFEKKTVKNLLFAPCPRSAIITGKIAAGWIATFTIAGAALLAGDLLGATRPGSGRAWASAVLAVALAALFSCGLGIAVGTWGRRRQPVSVAATILAVELFAFSGGLGVIFFMPPLMRRIAAWDPLTYAVHALQEAVFYGDTAGAGKDAAVLAGASLAAALIGVWAMRRRLAR